MNKPFSKDNRMDDETFYKMYVDYIGFCYNESYLNNKNAQWIEQAAVVIKVAKGKGVNENVFLDSKYEMVREAAKLV